MAKISSDYYVPQAGPKVTTNGDNGALGKDAFLQILITQLQNQDPTSPMDDKDFIAQMAQFSSLEQMQNMTKAMENLLMSQQETQLLSYTNFIGKEIKWHEITDKVDSNNVVIVNEGSGIISELRFKDGSPIFVLEDGKELTPGNISSILGNKVKEENPLVEASQLIGSKISYKDGDTLIEAIIESIVSNKTGIEYILNNGMRVTRDQFTLV